MPTGAAEILCGREGFCVFCKTPRLLSDSKSEVADRLDFEETVGDPIYKEFLTPSPLMYDR
jgi:hypothetical protein